MKINAKKQPTDDEKKPKDARFIRHGEVLDQFLLTHYRAAGFGSPNEYIVGLIRAEMQAIQKPAIAA